MPRLHLDRIAEFIQGVAFLAESRFRAALGRALVSAWAER